MTEPESKDASPEAVAFAKLLDFNSEWMVPKAALALDAAIAAGAEAALRRQVDAKQPGYDMQKAVALQECDAYWERYCDERARRKSAEAELATRRTWKVDEATAAELARLKRELASARELGAAERAVVETALTCVRMGAGPFYDDLEFEVSELLALRAKQGGE